MAQNSFEQLQLENEARFEEKSKEVKRVVSSRKDLWSFIGDIIELYIPQLFNSLIGSKPTVSNHLSNEDLELEE